MNKPYSLFGGVDKKMLTLWVSIDTNKRLVDASFKTKKSKSTIVREAVELYLRKEMSFEKGV